MSPPKIIQRRTLPPAALVVLAVTILASAADVAEPRFTEKKELIRPEGYHEWVFVGSSIGMGYSENQGQSDNPSFHNIYLKPAAYQQFKKTGEFPEGTVLVMEIASSATQSSINRQGHFEDRFVGIEAAVKDSSRFPGKWAYFSFINHDGSPKKIAEAFPQDACWSCHNEHGATDNVFSQFYPVLRHRE